MNEDIKNSLDLVLDTFGNLSLRAKRSNLSAYEERFSNTIASITKIASPRSQ